MKFKLCLACGTVLWSLGASAQIYEGKDEEGNTSFSDVPTAGAEKVDLQETNTATSVEVRPPEPETPKVKATAPASTYGNTGPAVVGDNDDFLDARLEDKRREELRDHIEPHDPGSKHPGDANPKPAPLPAHPRPSPGRR